MSTKYSKDKYACIKNLKNEPLANLTFDSNKRKLSDEKVDTNVLPPIHTAPFLQLRLWKWQLLPLHLLVPKVKVEWGWVYGMTLLLLWAMHTMSSPTTN